MAYGGISAALAVLALTAVRLSPTADLALYSAASAFVAVAVVEAGYAGGALAWLAAALTGLILTDPVTAIPFLLFFGPYPLAKAVAESRIPAKIPCAAAKLLAADILLSGAWLAFRAAAGNEMPPLPVPGWAAALLAQPVILVYDAALSMLVTLYVRHRHPRG